MRAEGATVMDEQMVAGRGGRREEWEDGTGGGVGSGGSEARVAPSLLPPLSLHPLPTSPLTQRAGFFSLFVCVRFFLHAPLLCARRAVYDCF